MRLAPLAERHLDRTLTWVNDPELMRLLGRTKTVERDEHSRWFASLVSASDRSYFAIEETATGVHIGNIWLWAIDDRDRKAEVRVMIGTVDRLGRGLGTEAIDLLSVHAFSDLMMRRLYAYVLEYNVRARRSFEKAGFSVEGRLRADRYLDGRAVDAFLLARLSVPD